MKNKKKSLPTSELGQFQEMRAFARRQQAQLDPDGAKLRVEQDKIVQAITKREALTGKADKELSKVRDSILTERRKEFVSDVLKFKKRESDSKQPSTKEESLTPEQQGLIRLRTGKTKEVGA